MGEYAAYEFYRANKSWLDSPEDAYEALYGTDRPKRKPKNKCPLCGKKCSNKRGVMDHIEAKHRNAKGRAALEAMGEKPAREPSKVGPLFDANTSGDSDG